MTQGESFVYTCCPGWGDHEFCAIKTIVKDGKIVRTEKPSYTGAEANEGYICQKGIMSCRQPYNPKRLLHPLKRAGERGEGKWEEISWDQALDEIAAKLLQLRDDYGPESLAMWDVVASVPPSQGLAAVLSLALCVAEARTRSGTLNTVHHAERLGRPVLAVPGSIYSALSEGTNELLRTHRAEPLCRAADVLEILGIGVQTAAPEQQRFDPAAVSPDAQQVYAALKPTPQSMDALCAATRLPAGRVLAACTELELMGGAQAQPGRRYIAI